jgi:hypothetical protein
LKPTLMPTRVLIGPDKHCAKHTVVNKRMGNSIFFKLPPRIVLYLQKG